MDLDRLRVVGLGDSTTAGTPGFMSPLEAPPNGRGNPQSQYAYWITAKHHGWIVLNRGVNGERSDQILARLQRDVIGEAPDYAVILAGVNDIYQSVPLASVKHNLETMYEAARREGIRVVAATVLPYNSAGADECKNIRELNLWVREISQRIGFLFCDTNAAVADPANSNRLRGSPDGLHPDVDGYRRIGEILAETIHYNATAQARDT